MSAGDFSKHPLLAFAVGLVSILLILPAPSQRPFRRARIWPTIHGVAPSVTSFGFGGSPGFHGVPPSVTSLSATRILATAGLFGCNAVAATIPFQEATAPGGVEPFADALIDTSKRP
jgi:hypothetical protein